MANISILSRSFPVRHHHLMYLFPACIIDHIRHFLLGIIGATHDHYEVDWLNNKNIVT